MDLFDLREGHDKNAFMERMVTDSSVTHVLVFTDKKYVEKANARKAGVGTESQIISQEVYAKVEQSKFIPVFCEISDTGEPLLPVFLKSRIGIDFSSDEAVNKNWEQLIRLLYGKPLFEKPLPGRPPEYITAENSTPVGPFAGKLNVLRQAMLHGQRNLKSYRRDFLDSAIAYADLLRVRGTPDLAKLPESILETARKLVPVRNAIVDWVTLEAETENEKYEESVLYLLERLIELKTRPKEITSWNDAWFGAHVAFVYECFPYIIAALLRAENFKALNLVLFGHYLVPENGRNGGDQFTTFSSFYGYLEGINRVLDEKLQYHSQLVELIKRQADRSDLPFQTLIEADALCMLASLLQENVRWYPQTFYYQGYGGKLPFFVRLAQQRHFSKLTAITGMSLEELQAKVVAGLEGLKNGQWGRFDNSLSALINFEKWSTLK